jgi:hypothetical protein
MKTLCAAIFMILTAAACFADVSLYLFPSATRENGGAVMADMATIEADPETAERIGKTEIADTYLADGYLDRKEIMEILRGSGAGRISIYGNGVRVRMPETAGAPGERRIVVRKGSSVRFQVVNACVRVEMTGTALADGAVGEVIQVKLRGPAVSRGRVLNEKTVELVL